MYRRLEIALMILAVAASAPWCASPALASSDAVEEYAVKAALVFNFARFTDWPDLAHDDDVLRVCVFDDDGMRDAFGAIDGRRVGDRTIAIRFVTELSELEDCRLLFVPGSDRERWQKVRAAIAGRSVLTVGEMNGFLESGGVMNLSLSDDRIVFQVNRGEARRVGLTISSRILKLASEIVEADR